MREYGWEVEEQTHWLPGAVLPIYIYRKRISRLYHSYMREYYQLHALPTDPSRQRHVDSHTVVALSLSLSRNSRIGQGFNVSPLTLEAAPPSSFSNSINIYLIIADAQTFYETLKAASVASLCGL